MMGYNNPEHKEFTGKMMLALLVFAFSIIIAVNVLLAIKANQTFPGIVIENSYVASQNFDDEKNAQNGLGWEVSLVQADEQIVLTIMEKGNYIYPVIESALLGRPTFAGDDRELNFQRVGDTFVANMGSLERGQWQINLTLRSEEGVYFRRRYDLEVK